MQQIPCPVCGRDNRDVFLRDHDRLHDVPGEFTLTKCACGTVYLNPMPSNEELAKYYPDDYLPHRARTTRAGLRKHRWLKVIVLRWWYGCPYGGSAPPAWLRAGVAPLTFWLSLSTMKSMIPWRGRGRILDVGCGNGNWLLRLKSAGWDVQGVEIDETAARDANAAGVPVTQGTLTTANLPGEAFDIVRLHYVFEHLNNPNETLEEVRRILAPDGICIMRIPNIDSVTFRLFGRYWFPLDVPRHVCHYTPSAVKKLARRHGLRVKKVKFNSPSSGFFTSIDYMKADGVAPWYAGMLSSSSSLQKYLWHIPGWVVDRLGKGDIVEYTLTRAAR